jgi:hypothetical protein
MTCDGPKRNGPSSGPATESGEECQGASRGRTIERFRQDRLSWDLQQAPESPKSRPNDLACQEGERRWHCPW